MTITREGENGRTKSGVRLDIDVADADGEVLETCPPDNGGELLRILDTLCARVRNGNFEVNGQAGVLLDAIVEGVRCVLVIHQPVRVELSPREQQIALMVASGYTNQAIASSLEISVWTVSTHLRRIFAKLAVSSRAEMVAHLLASRNLLLP